MKHPYLLIFSCLFSLSLQAQEIVSVGKGSYASFPPESVSYDDGYFAHPYKWFDLAWDELNLHENVRNRPIPTNDWWTEFIFRGTGRIQPEYHQPPLTVTTDGNRFGCEAWAYPYMLTASAEGFNIFYPQGFEGGGMQRGTPLRVNATVKLQSNDANVLFEDFEHSAWPEGWTVTVNSKNIPGPMATDHITQSPTPTGYTGDRFVNTFLGDDARFSMSSPAFTIDRDYIRLYVGGGNYPDATYVGLFVNGERVRYATGESSGNLKRHTWDVKDLKGQQAEIRIVDNSGGGWGFIMCDEIIFTDSETGGSGYTPEFQTKAAKVYDWSDLGFTLRSETPDGYIDATMVHGVPFVYMELSGLFPLLSSEGPSLLYNLQGELVEDFPVDLQTCAIETGGRIFGIHLPAGSRIHRSKGGDYQVEMNTAKRYVVVSVLPDRSLLSIYDTYARNKPGDTRFEYEYNVAQGKIVTTFNLKARNLDTGATGQPTLMALLPHHYRTTTTDAQFLAGADYPMFLGKLRTAVAEQFTLSYNFGGMPPYLPEPLELSPERQEMMNSLMDYSAEHYTVNGNTYAKGLGENSTLMLMAKALGHSGYEKIRDNLKAELTDWFTFDASEKNAKQRFFAQYPHFGAMIGFAPGYGSQGFNDLHFHNGYFAAGAARLMMVDSEFRRDFAGMAKLVAQNYANWQRYTAPDDTFMPFLRTFDPYLGHSFAGGIGDGGGNNQESTSEAINSWFGVYLLGVVLNDQDIINAGATGFMLENLAAGEYWLNLYGDNFSSTYGHDYVGIVRTDNLAWATYFAGDPAWVLGIQACPVDFFYTDFALMPERMTQISQSMFNDRTTFIWDNKPMWTNNDPYDNIRGMGPYLGGYHLNIMNYTDPVHAAEWIDDFCRLGGTQGTEWRNHPNTTTNYYMSNAMALYGHPAKGYHTGIPSGAVYENAKGELTYLLYNATDKSLDVPIYKGDEVIETIRVEAHQYYNSRQTGKQKPTVSVTNLTNGAQLVLNKTIQIQTQVADKDGYVLWVEFYVDDQLIDKVYTSPFTISYRPTVSGAKQLKVVAVDNDGIQSEPCFVQLDILPTEQQPFNGTPWQVPAQIIHAVRFDKGGEGISCHDNETAIQGGDNFRADTGVETENTANGIGNIGWTNAGEWFEYTINVEETALYALSSRLSSAGGGACRVLIDGVELTGVVEVPTTGSWGDYQDIAIADIPLKQGVHIMRFIIERTGMNLATFSFAKIAGENLPTEVFAGDDITLYLPQSAATLVAQTKTYGNVQVLSYAWKQIDNNSPIVWRDADQPTAYVSNLQQGVYTFSVTVTDSRGAQAIDQINVVVLPGNFPPVAIAGNDFTLTETQFQQGVLLDATASYDPDGTIIAYHWEQVDNNNTLTLQSSNQAQTLVTGFEKGRIYVLRLTVTDNRGLTATTQIRLNADFTTAVDNLQADETLVYPVPFDQTLFISAAGHYTDVQIYSLTGELLLSQPLAADAVTNIDTSALAKGCYLLTLSSDTERLTRKIIK